MLPRDLGLHLDALDRGDDEQREVGGLQRGGDVADEVGVAGRVEQVDLVAVELERRERERHRDPPPLLLGVEVADGVPSSTLPEAGDRAGGEQQGLGQRGLAGAAVADEGDVADLGRRERLHQNPRRLASCRSGDSTERRDRATVRSRRPGRGGTLGVLAGASAVVPLGRVRASPARRRSPPTRRSSRMLDRRWRARRRAGPRPARRAACAASASPPTR